MTLGKQTKTLGKNPNQKKTITLKDLEGKEMLDLHDVAALLGVSHRHVQNLVRDGAIPCHKVGGIWRVPREALCRQYNLGEYADRWDEAA